MRIVPTRLLVVGSMVLMCLPSLSSAADEWSLDTLRKLPCDQLTQRLQAGLDAKNVEAMRTAGLLIDTGVCFTENPRTAAGFYQRASDAGDKLSRERLALLFAKGRGVDQDYASAGALLRPTPLKADEALTDDDYTRGYAYLLSVAAAVEFNQRKGAEGSTGVSEFRSLPFSFTATQPLTSVTIAQLAIENRSVRSAMQRALADALELAAPKVPAPDKARLTASPFSIYFVSTVDASGRSMVSTSFEALH